MFLGVVMGISFLHKLGQKMVIFRGFSKILCRTTGFQLNFVKLIELPNIFHSKPAKKIKVAVVLGQNLGQIRSNIVKKSQEKAIIIRFFSYFTWRIPFKAKSSGCKTTCVGIYIKYS